MYARYIRRYKIANLVNVLVFMAVISGISILYGKVQMLQGQTEERVADRARLLQHEQDLSIAQSTIAGLMKELEALREEVRAQQQANIALEARLQRGLKRIESPGE